MRILIILTYYRPYTSGLTIHAEREARALLARGHQVVVLTSRHINTLPAHEVMDGVEVYRSKVWARISKGALMPTMFLQGGKLAHQADVIHLHLPQLDAAPIAIICRLRGKPVVVTYHCDLALPSGVVNFIANKVSDVASHITCKLADVIVHNTRDYAENSPFLRRYLEKVFPILPPVVVPEASQDDINAFREKYHLVPGQAIIGMAARLAAEKGVEYMVEALPRVLEKYPQARLLFVGPYQNVLGEEQYARRLLPLVEKLGQHWEFLGVIPAIELAAFFRVSNLMVLPSINSTESYGLVQVESMTCGTPVVASDLPGVRVPVQMTGMGRIVPRANAEALAQAIIEMLDHPDQYRRDPSEIIRLSSPEHVAEEYEKVFMKAKGDL